MKNAADSTWPRIVFGLAVLVFLAAVGWAVNSAVNAYESHRERSAQAAKTTNATPASAMPQPAAAPVAPDEGRARRSVAQRLEVERARLEKELDESRARLEAELKASRESEPAAESSSESQPAPLRAGGTVTPPVRIAGREPDYTKEALARRVEGVVVLEAIIEADGQVSSTRVLHGLDRSLDQAARAAVAQWRFEPATQDGEPVRVYYTLTINFRLR